MFSIKENIKKWSMICLLSPVGVSLFGQSADIPILPLPKVAVVGEISSEKITYGKLTFGWKGTDFSLYKAVVSEFDQWVVPASGAALEVNCEKMTSVKALRSVLKALELDEKLAEKIGAEGYIIAGGQREYRVIAGNDTGILYGLQSIKQLLRSGYTAADIKVVDWPDFSNRIFFDDISRGPTSTVEFVKEQIRHLSEMKYNGLTFYIEHVVQPLSHPDFAPVNGKFTMEDIREICNYAREYQMEVIGSFQCFGHFENILAVEKYASLGDTPSMIAPLNPDARSFLQTVLGELADTFSSDYFNINCDEVWDLGKSKSAGRVAEIGADRFFADHILFLHQTLGAKGKKIMMWGDMIMKYPHLIDRLPRDIVYLTWNYGGIDYEP
ncbi:MAG: beta-N-acetylhexosaminidase [Bacteroides sp.]|nr:beta-N-acetylhexosaminidase [Bacteroides sp.]